MDFFFYNTNYVSDSIRKVGVRVGGAWSDTAGAAHNGTTVDTLDDEADIPRCDRPIETISRASILDDDVADGVHVDAAVGVTAGVALDAVAEAGRMDARAVAYRVAVARA